MFCKGNDRFWNEKLGPSNLKANFNQYYLGNCRGNNSRITALIYSLFIYFIMKHGARNVITTFQTVIVIFILEKEVIQLQNKQKTGGLS